MRITSELRDDIKDVINLAMQYPLDFNPHTHFAPQFAQPVNFMKDSADMDGMMVGYSLDLIDDRCCYRHLSVSYYGETPSRWDVIALASAFGLGRHSKWSQCSITPRAVHIYKIVLKHLH